MMSSSILIRSGGLAAMAGGLAYAGLGLAEWYMEHLNTWGVQLLDSVCFVLLGLGALAAVASLLSLHRSKFYGLIEVLVSLVALAGVALMVVGGLGNVLRLLHHDTDGLWYFTPLFWGLRLAGLGGAGLGVVTLLARVLPWWCGVALLVGSPGFAVAGLFGGIWETLVGVAWILVGIAIFRAARVPEQTSRVS